MADTNHPEQEASKLFEDVREFLEQQPMTGADWPDLLDHVNHLDDEGYHGEFRLEPDMRQEDVVFRLGLAAGYACGIRDGEDDG